MIGNVADMNSLTGSELEGSCSLGHTAEEKNYRLCLKKVTFLLSFKGMTFFPPI